MFVIPSKDWSSVKVVPSNVWSGQHGGVYSFLHIVLSTQTDFFKAVFVS